MLSLLFIWLIIEIIFYFTHKRPLTENEIKLLMSKRRKKYIKENYSFQLVNSQPDMAFKSTMKPMGQIYKADIKLSDFPSYAANLLKYKKHEWVVIAFVKNNKVVAIYANKGENNGSVSLNLDSETVFKFSAFQDYQTVMRFHNHPNSYPSVYNCLLASEQDKISAKHMSSLASQYNINWLDFVCERGRFLEYYKSFSDNFYPENSSYNQIVLENQNEKNYYKLQREIGIFRNSKMPEKREKLKQSLLDNNGKKTKKNN